jgi:hypothetical protein
MNPTTVLSRAAAAVALLCVAKRLLLDPEPGAAQRPWAARIATAAGFPASAVDEDCPRCGIDWGTTWLYGDPVLGLNWWIHDTSHEEGVTACGMVWPTRIRRPSNGIWFVVVDHGDTNCLFCGERRMHPDGRAAEAYSRQHTAMHEAEVTS